MSATTLIVGQGLAGTLLGWEMERTGWPFAIVDAGHELAASRIAAGIINPITGQRFVKSWRLDHYYPVAREIYRALEADCGVRIWRDMRVRRWFRSDRERGVALEKHARGEFAPHVKQIDEKGFWVEGAAHVDIAALISASRQRWLERGQLRVQRVELESELERFDRVIDCRGCSGAIEAILARIPWEFSKGESLLISTDGLVEDEILNRGNWLLPLSGVRARVGSTHQPGIRDHVCTPEGRAILEASVRELTDRSFSVLAQEAGVRVYVPDRHPVMGWISPEKRIGVFNGLGAKGALYAPAMAKAWVAHLANGEPIDAELDIERI